MRGLKRLTTSVGDRMLARLVPESKAGACCDLAGQCEITTSGCACRNGRVWMREVCADCNCNLQYGPCRSSNVLC